MPPVLLLAMAIVLEIMATTALKLSDGLSKPAWAAVVVAGYGASFFLLSKALQTIPIGWAYAVWSGVGTVGTALIGLAWCAAIALDRK